MNFELTRVTESIMEYLPNLIAARVAILILAGSMALRQIGVASDIINLAFGLILGAAAVAVAIAFGFGGREIAAKQLREWQVSLNEKPDSE